MLMPGSKDESFFEAKPWLDSDSDDGFHSVRGGKNSTREKILHTFSAFLTFSVLFLKISLHLEAAPHQIVMDRRRRSAGGHQ
jgi:hypothetical protein